MAGDELFFNTLVSKCTPRDEYFYIFALVCMWYHDIKLSQFLIFPLLKAYI